MRERFLQRFDANHDGKLDEAARAAARAEWQKRLAEHGGGEGRHHGPGAFGPGGPGEFGPDGFGGPPPHWRKLMRWHRHLRAMWHHRVMARFDHDHDGRLNDAEYAEARKAREEMRARAKEHRQMVLARFDANHDGKLDPGERKELRNAWQEFLQARPVLPAPAAATPPPAK